MKEEQPMPSPTVTERRTALEPPTRDDFADPPEHPATAVRSVTGHQFVHVDPSRPGLADEGLPGHAR